jgi:Zn-dependent protease
MSRILLLLFAGLKFGKFGITILSMIVSLALYAMIYGWRYAAGFIGLIFVHEMGHYLAARQRGLPVGAPTFIPFVGAWIQLKEMPHDAETEAFVGLAGPLLGTVGAIACWFVARDQDLPWLLAVSYAGFFLNLFNMIPLSPMDGGRIVAVLSPRIWLIGVPVLGLMMWYRFSMILVLIAILAAPQVMQALRYRSDSPEARTYYAVSPRVRWEYGFYYVVLLAFLAMMTHDVDQQLRGVREGAGERASISAPSS